MRPKVRKIGLKTKGKTIAFGCWSLVADSTKRAFYEHLADRGSGLRVATKIKE